MNCCAICTSTKPPFTPQPLGRNNALVPVCSACDEPIFARTGPDRSYEPTGGMVNRDAMTAAARRVMGDAEYERLAKVEDLASRTPAHAMAADEKEAAAYAEESKRRIETRRHTWAPNGRRRR